MTDFLREALALTKAQASVRVMNEEEMMSMVASLAKLLQNITLNEKFSEETPANTSIMDAKKSIKEKTVTCLECGKVMKIITKKHLALHNLDAVSYREKYGLKKGTPLACKELQRKRKAKMKDMRLWERRADKRKIDFGSVEDL